MKARIVAVALVGLGCYSAIGQEYDDVYFSKKDRDKQQALVPKTLKTLDKSSEGYPVVAKANRKMDGYTGRTINPDYQSNYATGTEVSSYFVPNYQPRVANSGFNSMYANNGCYSCNSGLGMRNRFGFGMGMSPFYSPFNSSFGYSSWGYNSYGMNGYGGYGMYDPWNSYGYNSWNSPYSSWGNPYYGSGWGMGYGYGSGLFGSLYSNNYNYYPVANNPDNQVHRSYGKRSSRNSSVVSSGAMNRGSQVVTGGQTNPDRGGRVATSGTSTGSRYYQRGWRQDPNVNPSVVNTGTSHTRSSGWVGSGNTNTGRTPRWSNPNSGWNNSSWNNSTFGGGGGSRGSSFSTGGGSRSSGGSFGGGSSGGGRSSGGGGHSGGGSRGRN